MKAMSRDFTLREKILLVVLAAILLGLIYYQFVDRPVREAIVSYEADAQMYQTQIDVVQSRLMYLRGIRNRMDELEANAGGKLSYMASYNNSKDEVNFLNSLLADTLQYSITFSDVTRSGNQIRRNFTLQYQTKGYDAAQEIQLKLLKGHLRCLVGDIRCTIGSDRTVTINETATFYETMVGGTPDAGLPADKASVKL